MAQEPTGKNLRRILYVEDEEDIRMVGEMSLVEVGGFEVCACASGPDALAAAAAFAPDLILLDVMMPGMDGPTVLRALRELPALAAVPAIFMTAKIMATEIAELKAAGAVEVVPKPFDPMTLPDEIRAIWSRLA
jgi:two-component system OmpR family response regulator